MITFKELLGNHTVAEVPISHQHNLEELLVCVNKFRADYGKPMRVTSPYRSIQDHLRIYAAKGITDQSKIPMKSKHLFGLAVDFADPDGSLYAWAKAHEDKLAEYGIWAELDTKGWLHCQCVPYGSFTEGKSRFFKP